MSSGPTMKVGPRHQAMQPRTHWIPHLQGLQVSSVTWNSRSDPAWPHTLGAHKSSTYYRVTSRDINLETQALLDSTHPRFMDTTPTVFVDLGPGPRDRGPSIPPTPEAAGPSTHHIGRPKVMSHVTWDPWIPHFQCSGTLSPQTF